jgi:AcrR family transcriptional regulator
MRDSGPAQQFEDTPPWKHNFDNIKVRAVNTAWNLLLARDLSEITFTDLAEACGMSRGAIYHHLKSLTALAELLTCFSYCALLRDMAGASEGGQQPLQGIRGALEFAGRRPHHWTLVSSPRFNAVEDVVDLRQKLNNCFDTLLHNFLGRAPRDDEKLRFKSLLFGGAALLATRASTVDELMAPLTATLEAWRDARAASGDLATAGSGELHHPPVEPPLEPHPHHDGGEDQQRQQGEHHAPQPTQKDEQQR